MKKSERQQLIKRYGGLYRRASVPMEECIYCGDTRECLDHVPPIAQLPNLDVKELIKRGIKFLLYPACLECNKYLSNRLSIDLLDRMAYLAGKYIDKADSIEIWTEAEIALMGPNMQTVIRNSQSKAAMFMGKAQRIMARSDKMEGRYDGE